MPWTREQCSMLVEEAADLASRRSAKVQAAATTREALRLIFALKSEFENAADTRPNVAVESIYSRYLQTIGTPLRDSYHFGQTFSNDFGRPYGHGGSTVDGFSAYGSAGRFSGYFRGEYQQATGANPYDHNVENFLAAVDGVPLQPSGLKATQRFRPIEAYVGVRLGIFDATLGKQSLWWGPGGDSAFHFSDNAEPFVALRIAQATPILLPGPFRILGRIRTQFVVGQLAGHRFPAHPWMNAQKITFQLTQDLEVGITRSTLFGGVGHPLTAKSVFRSFFSTASTGSTAYGTANDPGDRRSGFDFRWHLPIFRRYVTVYSDSLADDEPNPLASPRRSAWAPGLYISQFPRLRQVDLRFETYSTWLYTGDKGGQFIYWNNQYRDAYINDGFLMGSSVGRDARAYLVESTYWQSAQNRIIASFRQTKTGSNFVPGGGTQTDVSLRAYRLLRPELLGMLFFQYERIFFPILGAPRRDFAAELQVTWYPKRWRISR